MISEATQISPTGKGYAWTPGIYSKEQVAGWKKSLKQFMRKWGHLFAALACRAYFSSFITTGWCFAGCALRHYA